MAEVLDKLRGSPGLHRTIRYDRGTEFTSKAVDHWVCGNQAQIDFSRPGKPGDNAINGAFNGPVTRDCLSQRYFTDLNETQRVLRQWRDEYNNDRPHGSAAQAPPAHFRAGWNPNDAPSEVPTLQR